MNESNKYESPLIVSVFWILAALNGALGVGFMAAQAGWVMENGVELGFGEFGIALVLLFMGSVVDQQARAVHELKQMRREMMAERVLPIAGAAEPDEAQPEITAKFYVEKGEEVEGPMDLQSIFEKVSAGELQENVRVARQGSNNWVPLASVAQ